PRVGAPPSRWCRCTTLAAPASFRPNDRERIPPPPYRARCGCQGRLRHRRSWPALRRASSPTLRGRTYRPRVRKRGAPTSAGLSAHWSPPDGTRLHRLKPARRLRAASTRNGCGGLVVRPRLRRARESQERVARPSCAGEDPYDRWRGATVGPRRSVPPSAATPLGACREGPGHVVLLARAAE